MDSLIPTLVEYFKKEIPHLHNNYQWKIPIVEGFNRSGERGYEPNVELKKFLSRKWQSADSEERFRLANVIVKDWGGVRNNKPETLRKYVREIGTTTPRTPIKGVASYSKVYSVVDTSKYAIYDARVAVCLNAIQWNAKVKSGVAFNYISGRNNITGNANNKKGFAHMEVFKVQNLVKGGWQRIKRDRTYDLYLYTLLECLKQLENRKLYDLEMTLFANAEREANLAIAQN